MSRDGIDEILNQKMGEFAKTNSKQTTILTNTQNSKNTGRAVSALDHITKALEKFENFAHEHTKEQSIKNTKAQFQEKIGKESEIDLKKRALNALSGIGSVFDSSVDKFESALSKTRDLAMGVVVEDMGKGVGNISSPNTPAAATRERAKSI